MTGSVQSASKTVTRQPEASEGCTLTLTNGSGAALKQGQEVFISGNMAVNKRSTGAQFPVGIVTVGGDDAQPIAVFTCFQRTVRAVAKGGTLSAGTFVKPNGTYNSVGLPEYVAATEPTLSNGTTTSVLGDYVSGIVISGGNVDTEIQIGIFRTPILTRGSLSA